MPRTATRPGSGRTLQAALTRAGTVAADVAQSLRDTPPDAVPLRLVEAAQLLTEPVTLVLDDVHELAGDGPVLAGLDLLIRHVPPTLRLILSGRCPPRLQLARLRVAGELADVTSADLACTAEEAAAYFAMLGLDVDAYARDELLRRTEGWMAGLRLAAMSARAREPEDGRITDIAGDEPLVTDYLWDEVLGRQPAETRLFMLRTSITEEMSGDLADTLTGEPGGARTLQRLSRENNFVEAVGPDHAAYRYHPLLRDVLAAERSREIPHEVPILLRRAARWHAAHDRAIDALRNAAAGRGLGLRRAHAGRGRDRRAGAQRRHPAGAGAGASSRPSAGPMTRPWRRPWPRPGCGTATRTGPRSTWRAPSGRSAAAPRPSAGSSSPGWRRCG